MSVYNSEIDAIALYNALIDGEDIVIPDIDFSDPAYQIPIDVDSALYQSVNKLTVKDITKHANDDDGAYDGINNAFARTLREEFEKGRITGGDYVKAFIALQESAMSNAVNFLVQRENVFWQSAQAQAQAITARVQLEIAKLNYAATKMQALTAKANYCLTKLKLATEDVTFGQGQYQIDHILPTQKATMLEQVETARGQTSDYRTDGITPIMGILGKQKDLYNQQIISYQRDAENKAARIFMDAWSVNQAIAEEPLPSEMENSNLDVILAKVRVNNGLT